MGGWVGEWVSEWVSECGREGERWVRGITSTYIAIEGCVLANH